MRGLVHQIIEMASNTAANAFDRIKKRTKASDGIPDIDCEAPKKCCTCVSGGD